MLKDTYGAKYSKSYTSPTRGQIGAYKAELAEKLNKPAKHQIRFKCNNKSRYSPIFCKICNDYFNMITNLHAQKHGFKNADEMAQSDKIIFCTT